MNLSSYLPLTETTWYILIALTEPGHGYYIMQKVETLSRGTVRIAAGTMYGAIEHLLKQKFIKSIKSEDKRRKVYQITELGTEVLKLEAERLRHLVQVAENHAL
ncbi:PadR family transcriptional regulator [Lachnospiraceae bacterium]|nr:PadR family transcriptional regulator [Lachnospiraceae bacterium]